MDCPDPNRPNAQEWAAEQSSRGADATDDQTQPGLTRGQRLLACAMAAAVLTSGFNALIQVSKALIELYLRRF